MPLFVPIGLAVGVFYWLSTKRELAASTPAAAPKQLSAAASSEAPAGLYSGHEYAYQGESGQFGGGNVFAESPSAGSIGEELPPEAIDPTPSPDPDRGSWHEPVLESWTPSRKPSQALVFGSGPRGRCWVRPQPRSWNDRMGRYGFTVPGGFPVAVLRVRPGGWANVRLNHPEHGVVEGWVETGYLKRKP